MTHYKFNAKGQHLYREAWYDEARGVVVTHSGQVGFRGKTEEVALDREEWETCKAAFEERCASEGYSRLVANQLHRVVVQYPMKSAQGNKRDLWLKDKVQQYLTDHLGWYGLGYVDGFDIGEKRLNIYCTVVNADRAVASIKSCLKYSRLDFRRARIAVRKPGDERYVQKWPPEPADDFTL